MSPKRRDDQGPGRERTAEQRERDRLEREARRAAAGRPGRAAAAATGQRRPSSRHRDRPRPSDPSTTAAPPRRRAGRAPRGAAADEPPAGRAPRVARRGARRGTPRAAAAGQRASPPLLRIQPEPPAPPAAPAGELGDETERPIGIRRVQRAVAQRSPRAVVTPPGDVPRGPARARRSLARAPRGALALAAARGVAPHRALRLSAVRQRAGRAVNVTIPSGASAGDIGDRLATAGVVELRHAVLAARVAAGQARRAALRARTRCAAA